jgi:hypothetical protein
MMRSMLLWYVRSLIVGVAPYMGIKYIIGTVRLHLGSCVEDTLTVTQSLMIEYFDEGDENFIVL